MIFIFNISRVTIFTNSFPYIYVILSSAVFQISSGIRGRPAEKGSGSNRMKKVLSSKSRRSAKVQIEGANRLYRACEVARSNLKTSQGKMKARYDIHVIDRKCKTGDKVLALLPLLADLYRQDILDPTLLTRKQVILSCKYV